VNGEFPEMNVPENNNKTAKSRNIERKRQQTQRDVDYAQKKVEKAVEKAERAVERKKRLRERYEQLTESLRSKERLAESELTTTCTSDSVCFRDDGRELPLGSLTLQQQAYFRREAEVMGWPVPTFDENGMVIPSKLTLRQVQSPLRAMHRRRWQDLQD
jgi:hypothetical protein